MGTPVKGAAIKIAFVNQPLDPILPPDQNSIGIWTYRVASELAGRDHVTVHGRYLRQLASLGVRRRHTDRGVDYRFRFAAPNRVWSRVSALWERVRGPQRPIYQSVWYYIEYSLPLAIRLRRDRPQVIHVHNFTGFIPVIRLLNKRSAIVLHMSCEWLTQLDERTMARRIGAVDAVFGVSEHITGLVRARFPQFADRCHTVYNGVDPHEFDHPAPALGDGRRPGVPRAVFVGRVSPEKGVHDLIEGFGQVVDEIPDAHLDVVGPVGALPRSYIVDVSHDPNVGALARFYDRDYGVVLAELVGERLAGQVTFHGGVPHADVLAHVARADVLVNPSYVESFGMSLVEALACRTPVVAYRVGGMPEIVDDSTGILVEVGDVAALASAIVALLRDPARRSEMGRAGRQVVEQRFGWDRIAASARRHYATLLGEAEG